MEMKYPSLEQFIKSNFDFNSDSQMEQSFDLISSCIDKIYTEDEVWVSSDVTKKELTDLRLKRINNYTFMEAKIK